MAVDIETVRRIARLARLQVPAEELPPLVGELNGILAWVEQLKEVDTKGAEPMNSVVAVTLPQRADAVTDGGYPEKVLKNAPERVLNFYAVPKVVE